MHHFSEMCVIIVLNVFELFFPSLYMQSSHVCVTFELRA